MSESLRQRLLSELESIRLIDPHSHINPHSAASETLADLLGYHYYTELAHSAGMPKEAIEEPGITPKEKVRRLAENLGPLRNTIQYSWLLDILQTFCDLPHGEHFSPENWETLYDRSVERMAADDWEQQVIEKTKLDGVFLTNDFDDDLEGFDTQFYVPCLRTDDLVFKLHEPEVQKRLAKATGVEVSDYASLTQAVGKLFDHFVSKGAKACAISLPPYFSPTRTEGDEASIAKLLNGDASAPDKLDSETASRVIFWTLAEHCSEHRLPFDLMIGVIRGVYPAGVYQGQDLYDSRVSLVQYRDLFNAFPKVTFPISVLASVTNQELVSYAWIFPNVVANGHWWYSNTPSYIEHDSAGRLEAIPQTKQIGYYSDMYKLEFAAPKFSMYRQILSKVLAERYVVDRGWSEEQAVELGYTLLRGNVERIFYPGG